jgi:hypothetical protein
MSQVIFFSSGIAAVLSFWGWIAISILRLSVRIAELETDVVAVKKGCNERLEWMRGMEQDIKCASQNTAAICGHLNIPLA